MLANYRIGPRVYEMGKALLSVKELMKLYAVINAQNYFLPLVVETHAIDRYSNKNLIHNIAT
jgi:hypothetical protein